MNTIAILPHLIMKLLQTQNIKRNNVRTTTTAGAASAAAATNANNIPNDTTPIMDVITESDIKN